MDLGRNLDRDRRSAERLAAGVPIPDRVVVLVAHADDESLWTGTALARLPNVLLLHATDSAPRDMADAARLGFADRAAYAAARAAELDVALTRLACAPERMALPLADQEAALHLPALVDMLAERLRGCAAVVTHPYEGGHPDHDALALAAALAIARLARRGEAPALVEFACYHELEGERRFGRFWPDRACPEQVRPLLPLERARVAAAIEAHATQAGVVGDWRPVAERWRAAPAYDFTAPPPPGRALYDRFGWSMTSPRWRALAREALAAELAPA